MRELVDELCQFINNNNHWGARQLLKWKIPHAGNPAMRELELKRWIDAHRGDPAYERVVTWYTDHQFQEDQAAVFAAACEPKINTVYHPPVPAGATTYWGTVAATGRRPG